MSQVTRLGLPFTLAALAIGLGAGACNVAYTPDDQQPATGQTQEELSLQLGPISVGVDGGGLPILSDIQNTLNSLPVPTGLPSLPTGLPTGLPSLPLPSLPTSLPSGLPTGLPTSLPSGLPTGLPTSLPTSLPGFPSGGSGGGLPNPLANLPLPLPTASGSITLPNIGGLLPNLPLPGSGGGGISLQCNPGQISCNGSSCVSLASDPANCGACGHACAAGNVCQGGACQAQCLPLFKDCGGSCKATAIDRENCGACGNACSAGQLCLNGQCLP